MKAKSFGFSILVGLMPVSGAWAAEEPARVVSVASAPESRPAAGLTARKAEMARRLFWVLLVKR